MICICCASSLSAPVYPPWQLSPSQAYTRCSLVSLTSSLFLARAHNDSLDHLLQLQPRRVSSSKPARSRPTSFPEHHYEVLRSRPESSSLQSVSSSRASPSDDDEAHEERRHLCRLCHKRFNRPSSLRIHMNTHTGATRTFAPYRSILFILPTPI